MTDAFNQQLAYSAKFEFLMALYERTQSDELGALLGSMSLLPDGGTVDPAIWEDWLDAIEKAKKASGSVELDLK